MSSHVPSLQLKQLTAQSHFAGIPPARATRTRLLRTDAIAHRLYCTSRPARQVASSRKRSPHLPQLRCPAAPPLGERVDVDPSQLVCDDESL
ncbi:hypothetical protein NUW54_g13384 [Trametes sanguinea]|uniref:Uncharacterized protein n=1 Tax=Trametes sanguinea TaxID=158606 RepID=A0ACC1MMK5_9APHY|nr:hypothetical protein NUW54_g13384 [Trametes sanguinea]